MSDAPGSEQFARSSADPPGSRSRRRATAGNSSPLTDGAAGLWVASEKGLAKLPASTPRAKLIDWEIAAVDFRIEGLLMAPAFAIPRLLARHGLTYDDIHLWEIHEAFAAQVLFHIRALESPGFLESKAVKELAAHKPGERAIVSICIDGGQGGVALLEAA